MKKRNVFLISIILGLLSISNAANAAKSSKSGFFIGLEGDYDGVNYTHYAVSTDGSINQNVNLAPTSTSTSNYSGYLILGRRLYFNNVIGFGLKGWGGMSKHNNSSAYDSFSGDPNKIGDFIIKADAAILGVGAQMYVDFWNFSRGSLGLTLGSGYELTQFSNVIENTVYKPSNIDHYDNVENYFDKALVLEAALHLQLGDRNRFEVGYKTKNYDTDKYVMQVDDPGYGRTIGFNVKNSIYFNYTFSF